MPTRAYHKWTQAEIEWLEVNICNYSWRKIQNAFNSHFGENLSQRCIEHACLRRGITHGRKNEQGFIKGERNYYSPTHPIGSERIDSRGRVYIKVSEKVTKNSLTNWVQKNRYVYEQHYGKLKADEQIIHLNKNKSDCRIENLYKVSRAVNMMLGANDWFFTDRNLTLLAIKYCELFQILKKEKKGTRR